jgi:hypothetical protein
VALKGDYSAAGLVFDSQTLSGVERLSFKAGGHYAVTTDDGNVDSGQQLQLRAGGLVAGDTLVFDGSAEQDGSFKLYGGAGNTTFTGGKKGDSIVAGSGKETIHYTTAEQSTLGAGYGSGYDTVAGFDGATDKFLVAGFTAFDGTTNIALSKASLNDSLTTAAATLAAGHAAIFHATSGNLTGTDFLAVNTGGGNLFVRLDNAVNVSGGSFT